MIKKPGSKDGEARESEDRLEQAAFSHILEKYNVTKEDILNLAFRKNATELSFPAAILRTRELSSLEAIVKYLRENRSLGYKDIAILLNRNFKTLAVTYKVARSKKAEKFPETIEDDLHRIGYSAFTARLSVLEAICVYLRSLGRSYAEISRLINREQRTIWTVCNRAKRKLGKGADDATR